MEGHFQVVGLASLLLNRRLSRGLATGLDRIQANGVRGTPKEGRTVGIKEAMEQATGLGRKERGGEERPRDGQVDK